MSNNPVKRVGLEAYGLEVVENVPIEGETKSIQRILHENEERTYGACAA